MEFPHNVLSTLKHNTHTHTRTYALSYLSPQELSHADEHAPQPLVDGESRAGEGLPSELYDDDLQNGQKTWTLHFFFSRGTLVSAHEERTVMVSAHEERDAMVPAHEERAVMVSAHGEQAVMVSAHGERAVMVSAHEEQPV